MKKKSLKKGAKVRVTEGVLTGREGKVLYTLKNKDTDNDGVIVEFEKGLYANLWSFEVEVL